MVVDFAHIGTKLLLRLKAPDPLQEEERRLSSWGYGSSEGAGEPSLISKLASIGWGCTRLIY